MESLSQERLRELLFYDPDTGVFTRRVTAGGKTAGSVAGMRHKNHDYVAIRVDRKLYAAHRLVFLYVYGRFPEGEVDHLNRVRHDNRLCNLKEVSKAENQQNTPVRKDNILGLKGIHEYFSRGVSYGYLARIQVNGRRKRLGVFKTLDEAAAAYREAKREMHTHHQYPT